MNSFQKGRTTITTTQTMKKLTTLLAILILGIAGISHAADEKPAYPLTTCIVSGESLDAMGKPYVFEYEGQEVQLCCKSCVKEFNKEPTKYIEKLDAAKAGESVSTDKADGHADHSDH